MTHHVMLDLETLGTKPGFPILSIGAATFNCFDTQKFITPIDQYQPMMEDPDPDTLEWWQKQSQEARDAAFNNPQAPKLTTALVIFNDWLINLKQSHDDRIIIWGNGATFDEPILLEAMRRCGVTPVWTFRDAMCFRTLKELGKIVGVKEPEFEGVKHNALADAAHQAKWADMIFAALGVDIA